MTGVNLLTHHRLHRIPPQRHNRTRLGLPCHRRRPIGLHNLLPSQLDYLQVQDQGRGGSGVNMLQAHDPDDEARTEVERISLSFCLTRRRGNTDRLAWWIPNGSAARGAVGWRADCCGRATRGASSGFRRHPLDLTWTPAPDIPLAVPLKVRVPVASSAASDVTLGARFDQTSWRAYCGDYQRTLLLTSGW
jgi:hypothetical protein